ncbi:hypothetical protein [Jeotgalicoccus psychrophilus]|uniref:hypothetical protein n=1 Tax=Jeotgalicoccus psychrophilus TaxID=157228 RepID=UPI00047E0D4D|nr:hypothetical protein [Jeotgalicoccus psychrophilus]
MARVAWLILSEENTGGNELIIKKPISSFGLTSLNEKVSFMLTFSLIELTKTDSYKVEMEIGEVEGQVLISTHSILDFYYNTPFDIFTNEIIVQDFMFYNEGIHYAKLIIDGESSQEVFFKVRLKGDNNE